MRLLRLLRAAGRRAGGVRGRPDPPRRAGGVRADRSLLAVLRRAGRVGSSGGPRMSGDDGLDVGRSLIRAGVPVLAAAPSMRNGTWDPHGGTDGCGYWLPKGWQKTVPAEGWLDPSAGPVWAGQGVAARLGVVRADGRPGRRPRRRPPQRRHRVHRRAAERRHGAPHHRPAAHPVRRLACAHRPARCRVEGRGKARDRRQGRPAGRLRPRLPVHRPDAEAFQDHRPAGAVSVGGRAGPRRAGRRHVRGGVGERDGRTSVPARRDADSRRAARHRPAHRANPCRAAAQGAAVLRRGGFGTGGSRSTRPRGCTGAAGRTARSR